MASFTLEPEQVLTVSNLLPQLLNPTGATSGTSINVSKITTSEDS